jgi:methylmalonyl-CoA mutase N-terminal domain/subunit
MEIPIKDEKEKWVEEYYKEGIEKPGGYRTLSGIPIAPLYTPADIADFDYLKDLGFPGKEPYTRGVHPTMYRGRLWTVRQLAGFGTPEETNERIRLLLGQGATGINLVFDYPTLRGYNSDEPIAEADVGCGGVAIDSIHDMEAVFNGIPIDEVSASLVTCNPSVAISLLSMYFAAAEERGISLSNLSGTTQNDFLMETAITNAPQVISPKHSFKLSCDIVEFCAKCAPRWNPVSYTGYNYREAGVTAIQEVAFVLSNAIAYTEEMIRRGWNVDSFAPRLSFFFSSHSDFFEEIAKYRAARRLWYKIMKERFKAQNPRSYTLRFHVQTAGVSLTAQQPINNISRAAYQALAAVLGGAQSVHVDAYDEALCVPTEQAALVALRTQQILQFETNVASTIDPLGGSYYVEYLTNEVERRVSDYTAKIETMGGIVSATEKGWLHKEIANSAHEYQAALESGELKMVGVNCFRVDEEPAIEIFRISGTLEKQQAKLERIRKERDEARTKSCLNKLKEECHSGENVMPSVLEAVKADATIGEITNIFWQEFGVWRMPLM